MKPAVTYPDPERAIRDLLAGLLDDHDETATVAVGVPADWTTASGSHVQVAWDGTPTQQPPIVIYPTIRITAWSASTTEAKRLALLCQGLLLAHTGGGSVGAIRPLTGVLPARDPDTRAELATFTVRATVRSTPI